jgi:hypothetical protein
VLALFAAVCGTFAAENFGPAARADKKDISLPFTPYGETENVVFSCAPFERALAGGCEVWL